MIDNQRETWTGQHSQFLRRLTLCFCPQVQNKLNSQSLASRSNVHNRAVLGCERRPEYHYRWGLHGLSLCLKMLNTNLGIWKTLLPGILGFGAQQPPSLHYCLCFLARNWLTMKRARLRINMHLILVFIKMLRHPWLFSSGKVQTYQVLRYSWGSSGRHIRKTSKVYCQYILSPSSWRISWRISKIWSHFQIKCTSRRDSCRTE